LKSAVVGVLPLLITVFSPLQAQDNLPPNLAQVETTRSRICVGNLARLAELDASLTPYVQKVDRLNALGRAVSLEKADDVRPLDGADSLEAAVAQWFSADSALAVRYIAERDSTLQQERKTAREVILNRLRQAVQTVGAEAQEMSAEGAPIQEAAQPCLGAILVRSAVLEECTHTSSPVCEAAASTEPHALYRFVEEPSDLWDLEQYGAWTTPSSLRIDADGELAGATTGARVRHGNIVFAFSLAPIFRNRSDLTEEEIAEFRANLDSLGFTFAHPLLVMAPGLQVQANLPPPMGGETLYVVHFGDLSGDDVIWSMEAGSGGLFQVFFPAKGTDLARLRAGEAVSLTAVRAPDEAAGETQAEAIYSVSILQAGQATNVGALLDYMSGGGFASDLLTLVPGGAGG